MNCSFCGKKYSNQANLVYHQTHTKTCLDIQGRALPTKPTCRYCEDEYSTAHRLRVHEQTCDKRPTPTEEKMAEEIARLQIELADRDKKIARQQDQLIEILQNLASKRSKITHKTTTIYMSNHLDLSNTEDIQSKLAQHLDHATIAQGQAGIAKMVVKNILTTDDGELLYVCTDQDRHIFRYLNHEGKEVKDIRAGNLKEALDKSGIGRLAVERGEEMWTKDDGSVEIDQMMTFHPRVVEIGILNTEDHDHRFRNELARLTTIPNGM